MQRLQRDPHPILSPFVKQLWTAERNFQPPQDRFDLLPDSYIELAFSFGGAAQIEDGKSIRPLPSCYLVGLLEKPLRLRGSGMIRTIAARFYAWGLAPLLWGEVPRPTNPFQALGAEWQQLTSLIAQAVEQDDAEVALSHLHNYLLERMLRGARNQPDIQAAAELLLQEQGQVRIEALADACYLSRRQLERRFQAVAGVTPKALARKIRFEQARDRLFHAPDSDLATLAHTCGYADQAHLSREFKAFSERTPRQFAAEMRTTHDLLRAYGVAFLQDS